MRWNSGKKGSMLRKIDEVRNVHGAPAVFLRYARSEYVVIAVEGAEREMTRTAWLNLPVWQFVVPSKSPNTKTSSGK
jgi:hypothetical protein